MPFDFRCKRSLGCEKAENKKDNYEEYIDC